LARGINGIFSMEKVGRGGIGIITFRVGQEKKREGPRVIPCNKEAGGNAMSGGG